MDLSKAFDTLPHGLMIAKLHAYGISKSVCKFISSYLSSRQQRVKLGSYRSEWHFLKRGVPQGSVLGSLLFNIFINDLFYFLQGMCDLYNYADDNTLSYCHKEIKVVESHLTLASRTAIKWFKDCFMQANADKFQVALFTRCADAQIKINLEDTELNNQDCVRLLGLYIDRYLTFNHHVSEICKKAGRQLNGLARLSKVLSEESKYKIFYAFIISNFMYCPVVWHMCSKTDTKKMEKVQERSLRFVFGDFESDYLALLDRCERSSLYIDRLRFLVTEIYKVLNGLTPTFLCDIFIPKEHQYNFRNSNTLHLYDFKTIKYGRNSVRYQGAKVWNDLPNDIKCLESVNTFKKAVQKWTGPSCGCGVCQVCYFGGR